MNPAIESPAPKQRRMLQPIKDEIRRQREVALAEAAYWKAKCDDAIAELGGEVHRMRYVSLGSLVIGLLLGGWLL